MHSPEHDSDSDNETFAGSPPPSPLRFSNNLDDTKKRLNFGKTWVESGLAKLKATKTSYINAGLWFVIGIVPMFFLLFGLRGIEFIRMLASFTASTFQVISFLWTVEDSIPRPVATLLCNLLVVVVAYSFVLHLCDASLISSIAPQQRHIKRNGSGSVPLQPTIHIMIGTSILLLSAVKFPFGSFIWLVLRKSIGTIPYIYSFLPEFIRNAFSQYCTAVLFVSVITIFISVQAEKWNNTSSAFAVKTSSRIEKSFISNNLRLRLQKQREQYNKNTNVDVGFKYEEPIFVNRLISALFWKQPTFDRSKYEPQYASFEAEVMQNKNGKTDQPSGGNESETEIETAKEEEVVEVKTVDEIVVVENVQNSQSEEIASKSTPPQEVNKQRKAKMRNGQSCLVQNGDKQNKSPKRDERRVHFDKTVHKESKHTRSPRNKSSIHFGSNAFFIGSKITKHTTSVQSLKSLLKQAVQLSTEDMPSGKKEIMVEGVRVTGDKILLLLALGGLLALSGITRTKYELDNKIFPKIVGDPNQPCNDRTNPCAYGGICLRNGQCNCLHGASGPLCSIPPTFDSDVLDSILGVKDLSDDREVVHLKCGGKVYKSVLKFDDDGKLHYRNGKRTEYIAEGTECEFILA